MTFVPKKRAGVSLLELLIVLAIIGTLVSLGVPALMRARENARVKMCQKNVQQMTIAMSNLVQIRKKLPLRALPGKVGGWNYEILPFVEEQNLFKVIPRDSPLSSVPKVGLNRPQSMNCTFSPIDLSTDAPMQAGHYALVTYGKDIWRISEVPITNRTPWLNGQEVSWNTIVAGEGPHAKGYHHATNQGGVEYYNKDY